MARFKVQSNMKVKTLKDNFRESYGAELRIYHKNHFADDDMTLASIRTGELSKGGEFECGDLDLVGTFESFMKEMYGIKVQVASPDNKKLAPDNMRLCDLSKMKAVKERGSREKLSFFFNGEEYTQKNRLCQAVVRYYADQHPEAKLEDIQKVFDIDKKVTIVASREQALAIPDSVGKAGGDFFLGEGDDIDVRGGKAFVWKYYPKSFFDPFMAKVKELGIEVEVVGEAGSEDAEMPKFIDNDIANAIESWLCDKETECNLEKKKRFRIELKIYGSRDIGVKPIDTDKFDIDELTEQDGWDLAGNWDYFVEGAIAEEFDDYGEFELKVYDENDEIVFETDKFINDDTNYIVEPDNVIECMLDKMELDWKDLSDEDRDYIETAEHIIGNRYAEEVNSLHGGTYLVQINDLRWRTFSFFVEDTEFNPNKLYFVTNEKLKYLDYDSYTDIEHIYYGGAFLSYNEDDENAKFDVIKDRYFIAKYRENDEGGQYELLKRLEYCMEDFC